MTPKTALKPMAAVLCAALSLAACASVSSPADTTQNLEYLSVSAVEPSPSLLPSVATSTDTVKLAQLLFSSLVYWDEKGQIHNDIATSITHSADCRDFRIQIQPDLKYSDGTALTADDFAESWSAAAQNGSVLNTLNRSGNTVGAAVSQLFAPIVGFGTEVGVRQGLEVHSTTDFTVHLQVPTCDFAQRLGHPAFAPLPIQAFSSEGEYKARFGETPYGYGPYMLAREGAWERSARLTLVPNERYRGPRRVLNEGLVFEFGASGEGQRLIDGQLSIDDGLPTGLSHRKAPLDRNYAQWVSTRLQVLVLPDLGALSLSGDREEEGRLRRAAISGAIDRVALCHSVLAGHCQVLPEFPRGIWDPATVMKTQVNAKTELMVNLEQVQQWWKHAQDLEPWQGTLVLAAVGEGQKAWMTEVAKTLRRVLGIDVQVKQYLTVRAAQNDAAAGEMVAYSLGLRPLYPGPGALLVPLFGATYDGFARGEDAATETETLAGLNVPQIRETLGKAQATADRAKAAQLYYQAAQQVEQSVAVVPLWNLAEAYGWTPRVTRPQLDWQGAIQYWSLELR